jgi:glyoxylase-like metal-dependent hydrolase (beta-lactamase superfamily II)
MLRICKFGRVLLAALMIVLPTLLEVPINAQTFAPGYVDPEPILRAAADAIGADRVKCITISGGPAYTGMVGQQRDSVRGDWPRGEPLVNYRRTMNWEAGTMREEFDRKPGLNPASWKYGLGWVDGPLQKNPHQIFVVNGKYAWYRDGAGSPPVALPPMDAERWQLELWMNPQGFLKAARLLGANPVATWRWELGEMGRDLPETVPAKVYVVSITVLGKYRVSATIREDHSIQRIQTWVPDSVLGDMNYEHESTEFVDAGGGVLFPTTWHHHEGWDDNYQTLNESGGHNAFGGVIQNVQVNTCGEPEPVPESVQEAAFPVRVEAQKLADGVYLLGGGSHNSVAVEFRNFVTVIEAPLSEQRSLAVIEQVVKLFPGKPIRFLVNTHMHYDHIGGLRTYTHIGATIVTHWTNFDFYNRDVVNYTPRTLQPDMVSLWPPTELAEGYQWELVRQNYVISDGTRNLHLYHVTPLKEDHVEGMLIAYLHREKMVIEADLFDTSPVGEPRPGAPTPASTAFYTLVKHLGLGIDTVVPIHGRAVPWNDFLRVVGKQN